MMLKGMTAQYLVRRTFASARAISSLSMRPRAASASCSANGRSRSAPTVIGTVGSEEKAELARRNGADHAILYNPRTG